MTGMTFREMFGISTHAPLAGRDCTVVVGALTFFMKKTLASLEEADKRNAEDIKTLDKNLNDLKADLPLIYVTREDYIRVMNRVEDKLDQILYGGKAKGKEE